MAIYLVNHKVHYFRFRWSLLLERPANCRTAHLQQKQSTDRVEETFFLNKKSKVKVISLNYSQFSTN